MVTVDTSNCAHGEAERGVHDLLLVKNNLRHKRFVVDMPLDNVGVEAQTFTWPCPTELIGARRSAARRWIHSFMCICCEFYSFLSLWGDGIRTKEWMSLTMLWVWDSKTLIPLLLCFYFHFFLGGGGTFVHFSSVCPK